MAKIVQDYAELCSHDTNTGGNDPEGSQKTGLEELR